MKGHAAVVRELLQAGADATDKDLVSQRHVYALTYNVIIVAVEWLLGMNDSRIAHRPIP